MLSSVAWRHLCRFLLLSVLKTEASTLRTSTLNKKHIIPTNDVVDVSQYRTERLETAYGSHYKSKRVKVYYPATKVPPMTTDDGMGGFEQPSTYLPCHDCLILSMSADVEYKNGTQANPSTSFWLHHAVFINRGRYDTFCGPESFGQRFFAVGNERTLVDMSYNGKHIGGYHMGPRDEVALGVDLMNMSMEEQEVIFTVTYEIVEELPHKFISVEPVWLDIGGCETSNAPAKPDAIFDFTSPPWSSSISGEVVFGAAHLHDGATLLEIYKNDKVVCKGLPSYQKYSSANNKHIEQHVHKITDCSNFAHTKEKDKWTIKAYYNTSMHAPMARMDGSLEPVMGISIIYIAKDVGEVPSHGGRNHCMWVLNKNVILPVVCLFLGILLVAARWYQKRTKSWMQSRYGSPSFVEIPLLSEEK